MCLDSIQHTIQLMNVNECNGTNISFGKRSKAPFKRGEAKYNGAVDLSPNEIETYIICFQLNKSL